jgi:hypothetical protein
LKRAHMDFWIRWFELLHFGDYSALDTCSYGLLHSLIQITSFRWLLSNGHVLLSNFAFYDSNCSISMTTQHWTRAHMDFCIRLIELLLSVSTQHWTRAQRNFAFAESNCSISVTTQQWKRSHMDFCFRWFELPHYGDYSTVKTCS